MSVETVPSNLPPTVRTFDRDAAAAILGISVSELDRMRAKGTGPTVVRIARRCVYRLSDLEAFLADRAVASN